MSTDSPVGSVSVSSMSDAELSSDAEPQLTPRSKVRAALAAIDSSSDDENAPKQANRPETANKQLAATHDEALVESGSDDDEAVGPRGRLAARLHAHMVQSRRDNSPDNEVASGAYERVRRSLLSEKTVSATEPSEENAKSDKAGEVVHKPLRRSLLSKKKLPRGSPSRNVDTIEENGAASTEAESSITPQKESSGTSSLFVSPTPQGQKLEAPLRSGLFLTPDKLRGASRDASDSDLPADSAVHSRFLELVAKKRAEREAKTAAEEAKRQERIRRLQRSSSIADILENPNDDDGVTGEKFTKQAKPTRQASKKAMEEMARETQRMSRNMQLTHLAKTKKKISKQSLLDKFNFRKLPTKTTNPGPVLGASSSANSSAPVSDAEGAKGQETPSTSPLPSPVGNVGKGKTKEFVFQQQDLVAARATVEDELLSSDKAIHSSPLPVPKAGKEKGKAIDFPAERISIRKSKKTVFTQQPLKIKLPDDIFNKDVIDLGEELEIVRANKPRRTVQSLLPIFDRLQPKSSNTQSRSLQTLRALANLTSPGKVKPDPKANMNAVELQRSLQQKARQQAAKERAERLAELKAKGIVTQTKEERERDQVAVEDLLERARKEAEDLRKKEKGHGANEDEVRAFDDESEDEDYVERRAEDEDDERAQGGRDDEEEDDSEDDEEVEGDEEDEENNETLFDNEASVDGDDEVEIEAKEQDEEVVEMHDDEEELERIRPTRRKRAIRVLDDDDEEQSEVEFQKATSTKAISPTKSCSPTQRNPFAMPPASTADGSMGLTQAFAATMADSQILNGIPDSQRNVQDSMEFVRGLPEPHFAMPESPILNSLPQETNNPLHLNLDFSQPQDLGDSLTHGPNTEHTQMTYMPDPTQDVGFERSSPVPGARFASAPRSTADTVLVPSAVVQAVTGKKRGRLLPRQQGRTDSSDEEEPFKQESAFEIMRRAERLATKQREFEAFSKEKSEAKNMVHEQAEESEDEYAGLGGASDDESGSEDEEVRAMMDDAEINVNERDIAAFHADKERASDEKAVEKLFRDINSGMLRRKRGADFDLSDSDDDAQARRRAKRREFAKMRKALLEDEAVGKIAENPKKMAFLKAIEDRDDEEDLGIFGTAADDSSQQLGIHSVPDSQPQETDSTASLKRKRPLIDSLTDAANRAPPSARRTTRPQTLAEIRDSVSFLTEEPSQYGSPPEGSDLSDTENAPSISQKENPRRNRKPIIDRLSLARQASLQSSSDSSGKGLAFQPENPGTGSAFKVPSLLRRATTSLSNMSTDSNGVSTVAANERAAGGGEKGDFVRRGGGKRSSINYFAREAEKRKVLEGAERREKERRKKVAGARRGLGGLLGQGKWG